MLRWSKPSGTTNIKLLGTSRPRSRGVHQALLFICLLAWNSLPLRLHSVDSDIGGIHSQTISNCICLYLRQSNSFIHSFIHQVHCNIRHWVTEITLIG